MADPNMIPNAHVHYADDHIEMTDRYVVLNVTLSGINYTQADADPLADAVTKKEPVTCPL
jgi:hypothetical protein